MKNHEQEKTEGTEGDIHHRVTETQSQAELGTKVRKGGRLLTANHAKQEQNIDTESRIRKTGRRKLHKCTRIMKKPEQKKTQGTEGSFTTESRRYRAKRSLEPRCGKAEDF